MLRKSDNIANTLSFIQFLLQVCPYVMYEHQNLLGGVLQSCLDKTIENNYKSLTYTKEAMNKTIMSPNSYRKVGFYTCEVPLTCFFDNDKMVALPRGTVFCFH